METIGFDKHDHSECRHGGVARVESYCRDNGLNLTPVRRRVL